MTSLHSILSIFRFLPMQTLIQCMRACKLYEQAILRLSPRAFTRVLFLDSKRTFWFCQSRFRRHYRHLHVWLASDVRTRVSFIVQQMPHIWTFRIVNAHVISDNASLAFIGHEVSKLDGLRVLSIGTIRVALSPALETLMSLPKLDILTISPNVYHESAPSILAACTAPNFFTNTPPCFLFHERFTYSFTTLVIGCMMSDDDLRALSHLTRLTHLTIYNVSERVTWVHLPQLKSLRVLHVVNSMCDKLWLSFLDTLPDMHLHTLKMNAYAISIPYKQKLMELLEHMDIGTVQISPF